MKHTLLPTIPENFFDSHKSPFGIFCETHKGLALSDEEIKKENELRDLEIKITGYISEYIGKLSNTYERLLNADIKSAQNAINLMRKFMWGCKGAVSTFIGFYSAEEAEKENAYLAEKIDNWFEYFSKLAAEADNATHDMEITQESPSPLPDHPVLEQIAKSKESPIRKWRNGIFKCRSLPKFITAYDHIKHDLSPSLIRDYLVKTNGKPYSDKNIEKEMTLNGLPR